MGVVDKDWTGGNASVFIGIGATNHSDGKLAPMLEYLNERDKGVCEWKPVAGYEKRFVISSKGDVVSLYNKKPMKIVILPNGYHYLPIMLQKPQRHVKTAYLHRLVAETFIPNPLGKETVNHKDGDKSNNRVDNLEWATQSEQNYHATRVLHVVRNTEKILAWNKRRRLFTDEEVRFIRSTDMSVSQIIERLHKKCDYSVIYDIKKRVTYKDVI